MLYECLNHVFNEQIIDKLHEYLTKRRRYLNAELRKAPIELAKLFKEFKEEKNFECTPAALEHLLEQHYIFSDRISRAPNYAPGIKAKKRTVVRHSHSRRLPALSLSLSRARSLSLFLGSLVSTHTHGPPLHSIHLPGFAWRKCALWQRESE
jgi:hypothetical protein